MIAPKLKYTKSCLRNLKYYMISNTDRLILRLKSLTFGKLFDITNMKLK